MFFLYVIIPRIGVDREEIFIRRMFTKSATLEARSLSNRNITIALITQRRKIPLCKYIDLLHGLSENHIANFKNG